MNTFAKIEYVYSFYKEPVFFEADCEVTLEDSTAILQRARILTAIL